MLFLRNFACYRTYLTRTREGRPGKRNKHLWLCERRRGGTSKRVWLFSDEQLPTDHNTGMRHAMPPKKGASSKKRWWRRRKKDYFAYWKH